MQNYLMLVRRVMKLWLSRKKKNFFFNVSTVSVGQFVATEGAFFAARPIQRICEHSFNPHYLEKVKIVEVGKMEATVDEVSIDKHHPAILVSQPEKRVHKVANSLDR